MRHQLAQVNIARMRAPLDDPIMADFVDNLDRINALGAASPGFVWIMSEGDGHGGNTDVRFFGDDELIVNLTVWEDLDSLLAYSLRTEHVDFLRRRREWFIPMPEPAVCAWWIPLDHHPTIPEAEARLTHLRTHGPTQTAFPLNHPFPHPTDPTPRPDAHFKA